MTILNNMHSLYFLLQIKYMFSAKFVRNFNFDNIFWLANAFLKVFSAQNYYKKLQECK